MMSIQIRIISKLLETLIQYQNYLEVQRWLRAQRSQYIKLEVVNAHIAQDIGISETNRILATNAYTNKTQQPVDQAWKWHLSKQALNQQT